MIKIMINSLFSYSQQVQSILIQMIIFLEYPILFQKTFSLISVSSDFVNCNRKASV